ncbi:MAG: hypothetical protein ACFFCS_14875 [Candidatus Hodarchaeota archaeon]
MKETERQEIINQTRQKGGITLRNQALKVHSNGARFLIKQSYVDDALLVKDKNYMLIIIPELDDVYIKNKVMDEKGKEKDVIGKELEFGEVVYSEFVRCIWGSAHWFGKEYDLPFIYGGSGYGFMTCINDNLLTEGGIYGWKIERLFPLLANLGLNVQKIGDITKNSPGEDTRMIEARMKEGIDQNIPHLLISSNHCHVVVGYSEFCFYIKPETRHVPSQVTSGTWEEFSTDDVISVYSVTEMESADEKTIIKDAIQAAIDMRENPSTWGDPPYHCGFEAYGPWYEVSRENVDEQTKNKNYAGNNEYFFVHERGNLENREMIQKFFNKVKNMPFLTDDAREVASTLEDDFRKAANVMKIYNINVNWDKREQMDKKSIDDMKKMIEIMNLSESKGGM